MRILMPIAFCLLVVGLAYCEEPDAVFEDRSLLDLLVAEKTIGYRHDSDAGTFTLTLLGEDAKKRIREHYDDDEAIASRYNRLRREFDVLMKESRSELLEGPVDADERKQRVSQMLETHRELSELRQPNGTDLGSKFVIAASVTRYGTDYLVVRELHSMREVLIPLQRIGMVVADQSNAEPPQATEPAAKSDPKRTSSPPVR